MKGSTFFKRNFRDLRKTKELVPVARKIKLLNINREKNWAEYEYSHVILKLGRKNEFHRSASIFYYALIDFLFTIKRLLFHFAISYIKTLELVQQQQQQQVNVSVSHFVSLQRVLKNIEKSKILPTRIGWATPRRLRSTTATWSSPGAAGRQFNRHFGL